MRGYFLTKKRFNPEVIKPGMAICVAWWETEDGFKNSGKPNCKTIGIVQSVSETSVDYTERKDLLQTIEANDLVENGGKFHVYFWGGDE